MKGKKFWRHFAGTLAFFLSLSVCFTAAYFLTGFLYRAIGYQPQGFIVQIINSILGLVIAFLSTIIIRKNFLKNRNGIFDKIINAIEKIAKGDFNVRLDYDPQRDHHPFDELVKSVNNMAVELGQMEKMRQEFIANVSHEIQSPLTSIRGFAQALRNEKLGMEDKMHYLKIIESESMRLSKLSDNLLKLASLEAETIKFEPRRYRLDKQLRNIVLACEPQWTEKGIEMEVLLDEAEIKADEDLLSQVWINLIHNSIKFTGDGGKIGISLKLSGDKIEFEISDTGLGISKEDQKHIFERFYKADKSRVPSNKGSGLGLSIVKKIVDIHHGSVTVQSAAGEGTIFTVLLPVNL